LWHKKFLVVPPPIETVQMVGMTGTTGVTAAEAVDATELPAALVATTVKV
jgi:hypothetical protein